MVSNGEEVMGVVVSAFLFIPFFCTFGTATGGCTATGAMGTDGTGCSPAG